MAFFRISSVAISTITKLAWPVYALPWILSKYLALGVALTDVINACTHTPAVLMGMAAEIGTLAPRAFADIAIFKLKNRHVEFADIHGETLTGTHVLVPQMTIKSGEILFRQLILARGQTELKNDLNAKMATDRRDINVRPFCCLS